MPGDRLTPELREHLRRDDHDVQGWAPEPPPGDLACASALVDRLTEITRPVAGTIRTWVDGVPVVHHPAGAPIACASGDDWLIVRSGMPPGALAVADQGPSGGDGDTGAPTGIGPAGIGPEEMGSEWVRLDPWATDAAFARTPQLLRTHVQRAMQLAGERAGERATRRA